MAWDSSKTHATQLGTISNTIQWFDATIVLSPEESAHVEVEADFVTTPTDDMAVHVRRTLDDSSENWDDVDYLGFVIENDVDPSKASFDLKGGYKYRIGVESTGATDDHTSADMWYRKNGVSA